jgi:hypothetical protein
VLETETGTSVYIVDGEGKVAVQTVEAAQTFEGLRIITKGLKPGVMVIADGLQTIRPGIAVKTEPVNLPRSATEDAKKSTADASRVEVGRTTEISAKPPKS